MNSHIICLPIIVAGQILFSTIAASGGEAYGKAAREETALISDVSNRPSLYSFDREKEKQLDELYAELAREVDTKSAKRKSRKIAQLLTGSGSNTIDLLMERASKAMNEKQHGAAFDVLDQVISLAPDYAEGWNRRATLNFLIKDFGRSISDIEQVLKLEPRHIGALSGLAIMLKSLGKKREALSVWYKILKIYPANSTAQKAVIELEDSLSGDPA